MIKMKETLDLGRKTEFEFGVFLYFCALEERLSSIQILNSCVAGRQAQADTWQQQGMEL